MQPGLINPNQGLNQKITPEAGSQNLIRAVRAGEITHPSGYYASFVLEALELISLILASFFYSRFLNQGTGVWLGLIFASSWVLFGIFNSLLIRSFGRRVLVLFLSLIGCLVWFWQLPLTYLLGTGLAAAMFLIWAEVLTRRQMRSTLDFQFFRVSRPKVNKSITALSLLAILLYLPQWSPEKIFIPQNNFEQIYAWGADLARGFYPELTLTGGFSEFARSFTKLQAKGDETFAQLPPVLQERAIAEASNKVRESFEARFGIVLSDQTPLAQIFYEYSLKKMGEWKDRFGANFLIIWAVVVFFLLRSLGFLWYIVLGAFGFLIYQLLLALDLLRLTGEARMHEILEFN